MKVSIRAGKSLKAVVTVLFCGVLFAGVSGCGDADNATSADPTSGSSASSTSGDVFVVAPGVRRTIEATLPYTVKFSMTTPADMTYFQNEVKAPMLVGFGPAGVTKCELLEVRTYKIKNQDIGCRYPGHEPRYGVVWEPNREYNIEITQTTSDVEVKVDGVVVVGAGATVSPNRTLVVGWPPDGYKFPGLAGATIKMLK